MKKVLVMAASNSSKSINKRFAVYASSFLQNVDVEVIDLNDFEVPIYSSDKEEQTGIPELIEAFANRVKSADGVIISFAEHNGSYTAAFKNILDWASRFDNKTWNDKSMLLLATSPGARGGASVLATAKASFPHFGAQIVSDFSLPSFYENMSQENTLNDSELRQALKDVVSKLSMALNL